jgi:hypothetical protein
MYLGIVPESVEKGNNSAVGLNEVVAFLERLGDSLPYPGIN